MSKFILVCDHDGINVALNTSEIISFEFDTVYDSDRNEDIKWVIAIKTKQGIEYLTTEDFFNYDEAKEHFDQFLDILNEKQ